jgi:hypothetical protein
MRDAHQHADETFGHRIASEGFFDEFGDAVLHTDARPEALYPSGANLFEIGQRVERLLHRMVVTTRCGLLAQTYEGGAQERLKFGVFFGGHLLADLFQRLLQTLVCGFAIQLG